MSPWLGAALGLIWAVAGCNAAVEEGDSRGKTAKGDTMLTEAEREYLLGLARMTLHLYLGDRSTPDPDPAELSENLKQKRGCFVTLEKRGFGLRGCIGIFERREPLYRNVISRAIAAATGDPRFPPVRWEELRDIKIEISVLTVPQDLPFDSPSDLLQKLRPHVDGVILATPYGESTFLPQVWEQLPEKEDFLGHLCLKHGAPADTWKKRHANCRVQTYQALVFGEEEYGRRLVGRHGGVVGKRGATILGVVTPPKSADRPSPRQVPAGTRLEPWMVLSADSDVTEGSP